MIENIFEYVRGSAERFANSAGFELSETLLQVQSMNGGQR